MRDVVAQERASGGGQAGTACPPGFLVVEFLSLPCMGYGESSEAQGTYQHGLR